MKVILDLSGEDITPEEKQKIRFLLMDAIYEFGQHRAPSAEYVARRYDYLKGEAIPKKIEEVNGRIYLADKLHRARISIEEGE